MDIMYDEIADVLYTNNIVDSANSGKEEQINIQVVKRYKDDVLIGVTVVDFSRQLYNES